jgi:cytochrome P450
LSAFPFPREVGSGSPLGLLIALLYSGAILPERWIDTDTGRANNTGGVSSNYSILTFLHGPRSCIGEKFAKNELKVLMAVFVGRFLMEMADPNEVITPAGAITTKPKNGMRLRLQVLEGW